MIRRGPGIPLTLPKGKDGRPILTRVELEAYDPSPRRTGGHERYFCPIHGGDHQPSFSVNPATGGYVCFTCGAKGTLREHWAKGGGVFKRTPAPSIFDSGRREREARAKADADLVERLAAEIPAVASSFLAAFDAMVVALRDPGGSGALYLRGRGLDPDITASLGVGYATPNAWPGDRGRTVGRIVYPLADPLSGRVVSALGRLCTDLQPTWPEDKQKDFKGLKQRKLTGCPAGVWPYASLAAAREQGTPLVLVEGPADALALMRYGTLPYPVLALIGTADVLPHASLRGVAGVVAALDADDAGVTATRKLRVDLPIWAGVRVEVPDAGWLGGAKDAGELASRCAVPGHDDVEDLDATLALADAIATLTRAGKRLITPTAPGPILIETCLWCGTPTPSGVCCDDCAQRNARAV